MPHPKKASAQAKSKRQSGVSTFTKVISTSNNESLYALSEDEVFSESEDAQETQDSDLLDSITTLQKLCSVFIPAHLRQNGGKNVTKNPVSAIFMLSFASIC